MKNSLLVYKANGRKKNMGDYIQSLAAEQFTGRDVVYIEREHLHVYTGEQVKMIMNGWFMHFPENWPPTPNITPLFVSFHVNPKKADALFTEEAIAYFKKHAPIGCRDRGTEKLFLSKGIPAYFTGCLTLTLGLTYKNSPKNEDVCFVDPHFETSKNPFSLLTYLFTLLANFKTISQISAKLNGATTIKQLLRTASFFQTYSKCFDTAVLRDGHYVKHMVVESTLGDEEAKLNYSRNLLQKYSEAKLVVTSRIHAALPCLAMDTPVLFITSDYLNSSRKPISQGRFDGLIELFNVMEYSKFKLKPILGFQLKQKVKFGDLIPNKQQHLSIVEDLKQRCSSFISN